MAGNFSSLALATSFSSWAAPSSRLYSEWTCRWTNSACCTGDLLELDGGRGLVGDVVEDRVDPRQPPEGARQLLDDGRRQPREIGGHAVARVHRPQHDRLAGGTGAQRNHAHRELPDGVVEAMLAHE